MPHLHTLNLTLPSCEVWCRDCDIDLRLATYDEAVFCHETGTFYPDGPLILNDNYVIVVPRNFSLFQEV